MKLRCFVRKLRFGEKLFDSQKAFVGFDTGSRIDFQIALFQDLKIVCSSARAAHRENQTGKQADNQQSFYGVSLFLPE